MASPREENLDIIIKIVKLLLISGLIILALFLSLKIFPYLMPFFIGLLLAECSMYLSAILKRLWCKLSRGEKKRLKRRDGDKLAVLIYFLIVVSILVLVTLGITAGVSQLRRFIISFPATVQKVSLEEQISDLVDKIQSPDLQSNIHKTLAELNTMISQSIPNIVSRSLNALSHFMAHLPLTLLVIVISLMCGYYSINGTRKIYVSALRVTRNRRLVRNIFVLISRVITTVFRIVGGYILLMLITFIECLIGFLIIGISNTWIWALIAALVDILPILGISAVLLPMIVYCFLGGLMIKAIGLIVLLVIMTIARRMWEPLILGSVMKLHPLITILSMMLGIVLWGLSGVVLGPMYFVTLQQFLQVFNLHNALSHLFSENSLKLQQYLDQRAEESAREEIELRRLKAAERRARAKERRAKTEERNKSESKL